MDKGRNESRVLYWEAEQMVNRKERGGQERVFGEAGGSKLRNKSTDKRLKSGDA